MGEDSVTLVTSTRAYSLASDLVQMLWPLLDETNGRFIYEYEDGYHALITQQIFPDNYTGIPYRGVIRPTDGLLYLDYIPTSDENGLIYKYRYLKDTILSVAADTFPCTDACFRALVPAGAEFVNRVHKNKFDEAMFKTSVGRAARLLGKPPQRNSYA